jgi:hypothetical protein
LYSCPLGGAVAVIASVDLKHYNPIVITFGAPQPFLLFLGECYEFNTANHYQFVNVLANRYDQVTQQINPYSAEHLGHKLLLLDGEDTMIGHPWDSTIDIRRPQSLIPHLLYFERIKRIYERGCFPVIVGGWPNGHDCRYSDECDSGNCVDERCQLR